MDAIINWGVTYVAAHPKIASWLLVVMAIDQILKTIKGALKLNISDNVFDTVGDIIGKLVSKVQPPKN